MTSLCSCSAQRYENLALDLAVTEDFESLEEFFLVPRRAAAVEKLFVQGGKLSLRAKRLSAARLLRPASIPDHHQGSFALVLGELTDEDGDEHTDDAEGNEDDSAADYTTADSADSAASTAAADSIGENSGVDLDEIDIDNLSFLDKPGNWSDF